MILTINKPLFEIFKLTNSQIIINKYNILVLQIWVKYQNYNKKNIKYKGFSFCWLNNSKEYENKILKV